MLIPLLEGPRDGRPGRRAGQTARRLHADRGYDHDKYHRLLRQRGIKPLIARRGVAHGSGLGKTRWVVERTLCATRRSVCIPGSLTLADHVAGAMPYSWALGEGPVPFTGCGSKGVWRRASYSNKVGGRMRRSHACRG